MEMDTRRDSYEIFGTRAAGRYYSVSTPVAAAIALLFAFAAGWLLSRTGGGEPCFMRPWLRFPAMLIWQVVTTALIIPTWRGTAISPQRLALWVALSGVIFGWARPAAAVGVALAGISWVAVCILIRRAQDRL